MLGEGASVVDDEREALVGDEALRPCTPTRPTSAELIVELEDVAQG
jgi:hypothetical protein